MDLKKIIGINILLLIIVYSFFEFIVFDIYEKNYNFFSYINKKINYVRAIYNETPVDTTQYQIEDFVAKRLPFNQENYLKFCGEERIEFGEEKTNESPIFILGCSYTYGQGLKKEDTFPFQLSKLLNKKVYSFSNCGSQILDAMKEMNSYTQNKKINSPEYIIYLYMNDHINRYLEPSNIYKHYNILFDKPNSIFVQLLYKSRFFKFISINFKIKSLLKNYPDTEKTSLYLKKILLKSYSLLKDKYPNSKVIFIVYEEKISNEYSHQRIKFVTDTINSKIWKELEEETDVKVVRTKDTMDFYFDKDYKLKEDMTDWHPNEKVWKEFTPKFVEKYIDND